MGVKNFGFQVVSLFMGKGAEGSVNGNDRLVMHLLAYIVVVNLVSRVLCSLTRMYVSNSLNFY